MAHQRIPRVPRVALDMGNLNGADLFKCPPPRSGEPANGVGLRRSGKAIQTSYRIQRIRFNCDHASWIGVG
eukprot:2556589-Pyramimonas_sp.AAC.1